MLISRSSNEIFTFGSCKLARAVLFFSRNYNTVFCLFVSFTYMDMSVFAVYYFSGCLCLVTISLVLSILVINITKRTFCKPLPRNIRMCLLSWPGKLLGLTDLISVVIINFFYLTDHFHFKGILLLCPLYIEKGNFRIES